MTTRGNLRKSVETHRNHFEIIKYLDPNLIPTNTIEFRVTVVDHM